VCSVKAGNNVCSKGDCTCPDSDDGLVCGSELPAFCRADVHAIYICRKGKGSTPEILSVCKPGTMCLKKPLPTGAACGAGNCKCTGTDPMCSNSFPDKCKLVKNSVYKCTAGGYPELVKGCKGDQTCVTVSDGSICTSADCKCTEDGTSCGEIFPLSCKIKTTALYMRKKGQDPVLLKDCYPNRCSASIASIAASVRLLFSGRPLQIPAQTNALALAREKCVVRLSTSPAV